MRTALLPLVLSVSSLLLIAQERSLTPELSPEQLSPDAEGSTLSLPAVASDHVGISVREGEWTLRLRVASPGADGLQLFIENLRLPEGARLSIAAIDTNGDARVVSSYEGVGPLQGDSFWTTPVAGSEAVVEVRFGGDAVSDLPFQLSRLRALTAEGLDRLNAVQPDALVRPELEGETGYANFRGAIVPFVVRNGVALFENDIILGSAEEIQIVSSKDRNNQRQSQGITNTYYRWTGGIVPYEIDPALPNQTRITDAIAHWNTKLAGTINIRPRNGEAYYIRFVTAADSTCSSYIGNIHAAAQPINFGAYCSTGNAIHEIGHAIGLFHEHSREDRNLRVKIITANITPAALSNFDQAISNSDDLGAYDYGSIMHYGAYAFSSNGLPTIETIPAGIAIGQRGGLSAGDIAGVVTMYPTAPAPTTVTIAFGSNPTGRQLTIDGTAVTAPASFTWTSGSAHTVSAPSATSGGTRYLFKTWSNGGAQTQNITVPTTATTYTANFQKQYTLVTSSNNTSLGTVAKSPASSDSFFNDGAAVSVSASPVSSACFIGWTGITAPPTSPVQVTVSQPYSITGNFQTGVQTVSPSIINAPASASTASISVSATSGCAWKAKSNVNWVTVTSGASGNGPGVVTLSIARTPTRRRAGTVTIGSATVTINQ